MPYNNIIVEPHDGIVTITLNRPEKLNAMTWDTWIEIEEAVAEADADDDARVIVFTGAGRGFCSGTDLSGSPDPAGPPQQPELGRRRRLRSRYLTSASIIGCAKPTIAAVNGVAVGAGLSLALACDIRIASDQARFAAIWAKRALVPDYGCSYLLPRLIGTARAFELMYTGDIIDAQTALRIGLVNQVVPHEDLMPTVAALAARIAAGPPIALELTKRLVYRGLKDELAAQSEYEEYCQNICRQSEDAMEGRRAFAERRDPVFRGR